MIILETAPGSKSYTHVSTIREFHDRTGIEPVMKRDCSCYPKREECLCGIDAKATAEKGDFGLDIGDKHDMHSHAFSFTNSDENPHWPSRTGNPSGKGRGNNPPR